MKAATTLVLISLVVLLALTPARADDMDIFGANVQPNVMILIDSSQSMNDQVASIPYDNNLSPGYPVINSCVENGTANRPCTTVKVYRRTSTNPATYTKYADSISLVGSATAQTALTANGFWSGPIGGSTVNLFVGNYLNYLLG